MQLLHSIKLGIKRRPMAFAASIFLAYSALWTVVESLSYFINDLKLQGSYYYLALIVTSVLVGLIRAYPKQQVAFKVGHSNTTIIVRFGDIFQSEGHLGIPVNEYFDSELGLPVSPKSLHGIVIERFFGGHQASFDQLVTADLQSIPSAHVSRTQGKSLRYDIGTTAKISTNSHRFLLFALCTTDLVTLKASARLPELVRALQGLCAKAKVVLGGDKLAIPLVGSGLSGIGLAPQHLLQLILLTLVDETKKSQFAFEIDVVIHPSKYDEVDLRLIQELWS